jgi:hypothetical protein
MCTEGVLVHTCPVMQHRASTVQLVWKWTELRSESFKPDTTVAKYNNTAISKLISSHNIQKTEL